MAALLAAVPVATLSGCTLAAYGLGVGAMVNDSMTRQSEDYASFVRRTEAENAQRMRAGQPQQLILSRRAWARTGAAP